MRTLARAAPAALLLAGCAAAGAPPRAELEGLRAEIAALRRDHEALSRRVDALDDQVARAPAAPRAVAPVRAAEVPAPVPAPTPVAAPAPSPLVPPGLAVVRLEPPRELAPAPEPHGPAARTAPVHTGPPPPLPTDIRIAEPAPERVAALADPAGRTLSAEADAELRAARALHGVEGAHALEAFAGRFPRHPSADDALVEASAAYAAAGREDAACALARRTADEYPASSGLGAALERLATCEADRGAPEAERRLLERILAEHPGTPEARRAAARLAARTPSPRQASSRSGP